MKIDHSHVLLSCARFSRHGERNACTIGLGHIEITVPHHPVRLHGMVQRQARHLSTTVSEFLQLPTNPTASPSYNRKYVDLNSRIFSLKKRLKR